MIIVSTANSNNRWVASSHTNYASALSGSNRTISNETYALVGQVHQTGNNRYYVRQYLSEFTYSIPSGQFPIAGHFFFRNQTTYGTGTSRNLELRLYDWGGGIPTTSHFRTPAQLGSTDLAGLSLRSHIVTGNSNVYMGIRQLAGIFGSSGAKRFVLTTSRNRLQNAPSRGSREDHNFSSTSSSVADFRPRVVVGTATENMLHPFLAAQIQLTDGSWVVLEKTNMSRATFQLQLRRYRTNGTSHVIWGPVTTDFSGTDNLRGSHVHSLTRDDSDTIYMCHPTTNVTDSLDVKAFTRVGSSESWNARPSRRIVLPYEDVHANVVSVQIAYHNVSGGRLVAFAFFDWGRVGGSQDPYSLLSAPAVVSGSGTIVLEQGRGGERGFNAYPANPGRRNPLNSTGTLLDMHRDSADPSRGYILTGERHGLLGSVNSLSVGRYHIHSNGNQISSNTFAELDTNGGWASYDPDSKCRVIATGSAGNFVKISVDARQERGLVLDSMSMGSGKSFIRHSSVRFDGPDIEVPSLPSGAELATKMTWDAVYFKPDNSVWIYYLDKDNPRRLMRTAFRVGTHQAQQNEVEVVAELVPSGHTIHAIRVQRNEVTDDRVLITAASQSGSGHHQYSYVDRINVAPSQPLLTRVPNYDSDNSQVFTWEFRDGNFSDSQSAYQLQIVHQADASVALDTGKVASTTSSRTVNGGLVPNNSDLMWRVRTWDSEDAVSIWSEYSVFSTSDAGIVTITFPSLDNDPDIFTNDITLQWDLDEAPQDQYRVTLTRTEDNSTFYDSGWISSGSVEHYVPSIESDVEYLVQVRSRFIGVESAPGYRLLTTHYSTAEEPMISIQVHRECLAVSVINPEPRGDRPEPNINRIYRRDAGSAGTFKYVGSCGPNDTFFDYDVASDAYYEYKARAGVEL